MSGIGRLTRYSVLSTRTSSRANNFLSSSGCVAIRSLSHRTVHSYNCKLPTEITVAKIKQCCMPDWATGFLMALVVVLLVTFPRLFKGLEEYHIIPTSRVSSGVLEEGCKACGNDPGTGKRGTAA